MKSLRVLLVAGVVLSTTVFAAGAQQADHPTYESLWRQATVGADCVQSDQGNFILVSCGSTMTYWYFTKPSHPAHPGVIRRWLTQENGAWSVHEDGNSFAPDAAQPAFKAWLAQIVDLDRQMKEEIAREHGGAPPSSN
jgi:hypothetical protein